MFLALRDLSHAKGRFSLIVAVVALMTLLVGFLTGLTGLTGGLAMQNISSLVALNNSHVVFAMPEDEDSASFSGSNVSREQYDAWATKVGEDAITPLGISTVLIENGDTSEAVALMAAPAGSPTSAPSDGIAVGTSTADALGVAEGDTIMLAGTELTVSAVIEDQEYSHRPVAWGTVETWHDYLADTRQPDAFASVLLLDESKASSSLDADAISAIDSEVGTMTEGHYSALIALEAFKSEIGSLAMMIGMLVLIATLVIGVFFLVWSMQRQRDIAVLKAVGATTGYLVKDALGQALLVLAIGAGIGIAATLGLGALAATALPFEVNAVSILAPAAAMIVAGVLGALASVKQITSVDPNTALQASAA